MKKNNIFKLSDLVMSVSFLLFFLYKYRITEGFEDALAQLIVFIFLLPVAMFLFFSMVMSIVSMFCDDTNTFSILSQVFKIISFLLYLCIYSLFLDETISIDYMLLIPVFGIIAIIITCIFNSKKKCKIDKN